MSQPVSAPVPIFLCQLVDDEARCVSAWAKAGPLLPRMLLGDDAGDVSGRDDEYFMDGRAWNGDDDRENAHWPALHLCSRCRADRCWHWLRICFLCDQLAGAR